MGQSWFKLKVEYPRVRAETREAPEGKRHLQREGGALRRCTNEAVRAMRPSQLNSRSRLAEAQCFLQHSGQTLAEQFPALVRVLLPAPRGPAQHGRMVRDECELMSIYRARSFPALARIG